MCSTKCLILGVHLNSPPKVVAVAEDSLTDTSRTLVASRGIHSCPSPRSQYPPSHTVDRNCVLSYSLSATQSPFLGLAARRHGESMLCQHDGLAIPARRVCSEALNVFSICLMLVVEAGTWREQTTYRHASSQPCVSYAFRPGFQKDRRRSVHLLLLVIDQRRHVLH